MSNQERQISLNQAEKALSERRLAEARQLYEKVQQQWPDDPTARQKMLELERLEAADTQIRELQQQADEALATRQYRKAQGLYSQAYNLAGQYGIQAHQPDLERKRNQAVYLETWFERINEIQQLVQQLEQKQQWDAALEQIEKLLPQIPQDGALTDLRGEVEQTRRRIYEQLGDEQKFRQAREAFDKGCFKEAIELYQSISSQYAQYPLAVERLRKAELQQRSLVEPALNRAEAAYQEGRWGAAFQELEGLRINIPENPDWRQKWLQIGERYGLHQLDAGRQANTDREFEQARRHFEEARDKAFKRILEVYPTYAEARAWHDEADDLIQIAAAEKQAEKDWRAGKRPDALSALAGAQKRIEHARQEGREYITVATTINAMVAALQSEVDRINKEAGYIKEGERLLEQKRPDAAAEQFRSALNALLQSTQRQAVDGLNRADAILRQFEADKNSGQTATDPQDAVSRLQAAYDVWPSGPDIARLLETTLVKAARAMRDKNQNDAAAQYANQALALNPKNREGERILVEGELEPEVTSTLTETQKGLADIERHDDIQAKDFAPLINRLNTLLEKLGAEQPVLRQRVEPVFQDVQTQQTRWQAYEVAYKKAIEMRDQGRWPETVMELETALSLLEKTPAKQNQLLKTWRSARDVIQKEQPRLVQFLEDAHKAYGESPQTGKYDTPLTILENAAKTWQRIEERINKAEGGYPADLLVLQTQIQTLRDRATLAYDAASSPVARDGLVKIQAYTKRHGTDAALTALEQDLIEQVRGQIPQLLGKAEVAEQTGEITEALDLLRQVTVLEPNDQNIRRQYIRLEQRKQLEKRLQDVTADYQRKLSTNSYKDAVAALRQGIDIFLEPGAGLPTEAENALRALLQIASYEGGTAFAETGNWREAQTLLTQLNSVDSPLVKRVLVLVTQWLETSRSYALRGVVASTAVIEDKLTGHRAARVLLKEEPNDPEIIRQVTATKQMVINQLNESATHRLERGAKALEDGDFDSAHKEAESVEAKIYGPVAHEFEGFFSGEEIVAQNQNKATDIIAKSEKLKEKNQKAQPFYAAARDLFAQNKLNEAQQKLDQIGDVSGLTSLEKEIAQLQKQIATAIEENVRQQLSDEMTAARIDLNRVSDRDGLQERLTQLQAFPKKELKRLSKEEQDRYKDLVDEVKARLQELDQGKQWYEEGKKAFDAGEFATAVTNLGRALENVPRHDTTLRVTIQKLLDQAQERSQVQRDRADSMKRASDFLHQGDFYRARQELQLAQSMGEEVRSLLYAAQAGIALQNAQEAYKQKDWEIAAIDLEDALSYAQDNPDAEIVLRDIHRLQKLVERLKEKAVKETEEARLIALAEDEARKEREAAEREAGKARVKEEQERRRKLSSSIIAARRALAEQDFETARQKVETVLSEDPTYEDALKLEDEIQRTRTAQSMLKEAETARQARHYARAQSTIESLLETTLPNYAPAITLLKQIQDERPIAEKLQAAEKLARNHQYREAREVVQAVEGASPQQLDSTYTLISQLQLDRAEKMTRNGLFQEARLLVQSVVGADPAQLQRVQTLIAEEEAKIIEPIEREFLDENYREALERCIGALSQTSSPDIRQKLETLQGQIVERRAAREMERFRKLIKQVQSPADLDDVIAGLGWLVTQKPQPIATTYRDIRKLYYDTLAQRLRGRMQQAEAMLKQEQVVEAVNLLESIATEADNLIEEAGELGWELKKISDQATRRREKIQEEQEQQERAQAMAKGQALLEKAETLLKEAKTRLDLDRARRLTEDALAMPMFKESTSAKALHDQTNEALSLYDKTEQALKLSQEQVNLRRFEPAETALRLPSHTISPLFHEAYNRQRELVRLLRQAEKAQYDRLWGDALKHFLTVIKQEPNLALLLESDIERCKRQVMERVIAEAQQALELVPPDWEKAREILDDMEQATWFTSTYAAQANVLRAKAHSFEWLAQAINQLNSSRVDLAQVQVALREARRRLPGEADQELGSWEKLLEAAVAWQERRDWQTTVTILQDLYGPAAELPLVKQLQEDITRARAETAKITQLEQTLIQKQQQMEKVLGEGNYDQVVESIRQAQEIEGQHDVTLMMKRIARRHLLEQSQNRRAIKQYGEAIRLGQYLEKLFLDMNDRENETALSYARGLFRERQEQFEAALSQASQAVARYDAVGAEQGIREAETIAAVGPGETAKSDERLLELRQQLNNLAHKVSQADSQLAEYRRYRQMKAWVQARDALQAAMGQAVGYAAADKAIGEFQNVLAEQAQEKLNQSANDPHAYTDALHFCALGLSLNERHNTLIALQREVGEGRDKRWQSLLGQIRLSLQGWELDSANRYLDQAVQLFASHAVREQTGRKRRLEVLQLSDFAGSQFEELRQLAQEWDKKNSQVDEIKRLMELGLNKVRNRDYNGASDSFEEIRRKASDFEEARQWQGYAKNMYTVVKHVAEDRFQQALNVLETTEPILRVAAKALLPSVLGTVSRLQQERRQAVYDVVRLKGPIQELIGLTNQKDSAAAKADFASLQQAAELRKRILARRNAFVSFYQDRATPPESFDPGRSENLSATSPFEEESRPRTYTDRSTSRPETAADSRPGEDTVATKRFEEQGDAAAKKYQPRLDDTLFAEPQNTPTNTPNPADLSGGNNAPPKRTADTGATEPHHTPTNTPKSEDSSKGNNAPPKRTTDTDNAQKDKPKPTTPPEPVKPQAVPDTTSTPETLDEDNITPMDYDAYRSRTWMNDEEGE
ncbi:MAG: hypothetical protein KA314_01965 [Chloroflexi bacterium]|nr:hypothetical protein [Chloroflexota bacterium]MBP8054575.1 hypothetical protein [Chloroflexota bacterium]